MISSETITGVYGPLRKVSPLATFTLRFEAKRGARYFAVTSYLPKISYMTLMDIFLLGVTLLVFASLTEVMITSYLVRPDRLQLARRIDVLMRLVFPLALAGVFALAFRRALWP